MHERRVNLFRWDEEGGRDENSWNEGTKGREEESWMEMQRGS